MPFSRWKKKKVDPKEQELREMVEQISAQFDSADVRTLLTFHAHLNEAWVRSVEGETSDAAYQLLQRLRRHIETKQKEALASRLRPCHHCDHDEFRVSPPVYFDEFWVNDRRDVSPKFRLVTCESCGSTLFFMADMNRLTSFPWRLKAKRGPARGPFR